MEAIKKRSLFNVSEDLLALEELIESLDGDITDPQVDNAISKWLEELASDQAHKCDAYVNLIRKWEGEKAAATAEAEQYAKTASVRAARVERLKVRLKEHMDKTGQRKIETATGRTIAIQNNGGVCPLEIDDTVDPRRLDERFQKISITVNTEAVRLALDGGEKLEFAQLKPRGTHLRIR